MLRRLSLKDFVIVDALELDLGAGFSVLTGETGAGKSILIDALQLALGAQGAFPAPARLELLRHAAPQAALARRDDMTAPDRCPPEGRLRARSLPPRGRPRRARRQRREDRGMLAHGTSLSPCMLASHLICP